MICIASRHERLLARQDHLDDLFLAQRIPRTIVWQRTDQFGHWD